VNKITVVSIELNIVITHVSRETHMTETVLLHPIYAYAIRCHYIHLYSPTLLA